MFKRKDKNNGNNRRTEEDSSDPGASADATKAAKAFIDAYEAAGKAEGPGEPVVAELAIETVQSDTPILAKRSAYLSLNQRMDIPFGTVTGKGGFGVIAQATCQVGSDPYGRVKAGHPRKTAPELKCECGYYAVPMDGLSNYDNAKTVTLLVELSGKVIEHEAGYRAQFQRVVECQVAPCFYCGSAADHALLDGNMAVHRFVCDTHRIETSEGWLHLDLGSLERRIGVTVTRLELPWEKS